VRFFFDPTQRPAQSEFRVRETPSYYELETLINDPEMPGASYFYVMPQSSTSMLVAACWGREPDAVVALFADPNFGDDWFKVFCETYPIQGQLFRNGNDERYSDGALVRFGDPDDGEPKWFVVTVVGNIDPLVEPDDPSAANDYGFVGHQRFLAHPRMAAAFELVGMKSFLAAQEYFTNEISSVNKAKIYAKGAWKGYLEGLEIGTRWMTRLGMMS
jgi:hypothetical protein